MTDAFLGSDAMSFTALSLPENIGLLR